jgi:hypothetical protein
MSDQDQSLADALAAAGFGYRPSRYPDKREVYRLSDGEVMGQFDAAEGWEFVRKADDPMDDFNYVGSKHHY